MIFEESDKLLGFGLMRLPEMKVDGKNVIDVETTKLMVDEFINRGFTYFDTAWMYHGFTSENATKEALVERHPRDSYTLADKLHAGFFSTAEQMDEIFNKQLEKTGVEYFDYYLVHDVNEEHYKKYTKFDTFKWLADKKAAGLVKHMGFSYHDKAELLDRVLTEHPEVEFVQLQINYLDWESENVQSRKNYEVCVKHNKPVIVMEPVKGGTLANVPKEVENLFKSYNPDASAPSWAIRFAASLPMVKMVLSGMGSMAMLDDNTSYMKNFEPLSDEELAITRVAADIIKNGIAIPCTGCAYCVDGCPMNVAIPKYFALYNNNSSQAAENATEMGESYEEISAGKGKASECIECGLCEDICPQHLHIRDYLKLVAKRFE